MQESMRAVALLAVSLVAALAAFAYVGTAVAAPTSCSNYRYADAVIKTTRVATASTNQALGMDFTSAKSTMSRAISMLDAAPQPCSYTLKQARSYYRTGLNTSWLSFDAAEDGDYSRSLGLMKKANGYTQRALDLMRAFNRG